MLSDNQAKKHVSIPALGFILASLLLACTLGFVTWHNLDREERLMETFLLKEGQTLIRAFEAGARTSMMMGPRTGNLSTLVEETAREESIAYIVIYDESGQPIASAGEHPGTTQLTTLADVLVSEEPLTRSFSNDSGETVFEVAKHFSPINAMPMRMSMMRRWQKWQGSAETDSQLAIYLGLYTTDFVSARNEDIKQSLILLCTLLLVGSGGLYGLFLSHRSQVARSALENMEIYTDNVIRSMPAGLLTIDNDRRIVSANRNALDYFGLAEKDLMGKTLKQVIAAEDCPLAPLLNATQEFTDLPMDCIRHDGVSIPLKVSASHLRDRNNELRGMVLTLRDQREIRAMEEAVERSRRH
ncbi:MAG TPA: PAS domain-containing protein, partial [Geopsychrobacteraceae bacterium]|nr:PAS domain-containing protein [Geopsychrobacteraceae bacterium]